MFYVFRPTTYCIFKYFDFKSAVALQQKAAKDPHKRKPVAERRPDYDIVGSGLITEGERIVEPTLGELIGMITSSLLTIFKL